MKSLLLILSTLSLALSAQAAGPDRPNFIFFITDDISAEDLGCYGNEAIKTPHLDRMAAEGMRFNQAYLTISSCSPSRCSMITGRYPHNTGAAELHTELPADQLPFPLLLKEAGYYTALSGKHHMGNSVNRGFDLVSKGKGPGSEEDWVEMLQNRPKDQPFFFWFASYDAHRQWQIDDNAPVYDPADVSVPPYLVDGPRTRQDLADYYHEVSRTDTFMGRLRDELKTQGIEGDTYVMYLTDNGRPFPRAKTRLYDSGIKTPLIIACPGRIEPAVTESLVSSIDLSATILELAGVEKAPSIQGVSFAPVLKDPTAVVRDHAFAEHNWHVNQAHERMVRAGDLLYIRNAWPELQSMCVEASPKFPAGGELWEFHEKGALKPEQTDIFLVPRPGQELYRVSRDPHQLTNLAGNPEYEQEMKRMAALLDQWAEQTGDTVPEDPTNDRDDPYGNRNPDHKRGTMPGSERNATAINDSGPVRAEEGR